MEKTRKTGKKAKSTEKITKKDKKTPKVQKSGENQEKQQKITKETLIGELVQNYPSAAMVLFEEGIHCIGCGAAAFESIEQGLMLHRKTKKEIEAILIKLNKAAKE